MLKDYPPEQRFKMGAKQPCPEHPEGYSGGFVCRTREEALAFKKLHGYDNFAIYELDLPGKFKSVTYQKDNSRINYLLVDSRIIKKIE